MTSRSNLQGRLEYAVQAVSWLAPALELDDGIFITLWLQLLAEPHTQIVLISQAVKIGEIKVVANAQIVATPQAFIEV